MTHDAAYERLPDLLLDRDDGELLAHVKHCHACQRHLFLLSRVDRLLRRARPARPRIAASARVVVAAAGAVAAAIAIATTAVMTRGSHPAAAAFVLKTGEGVVVAQARIERGDAENDSIALVAHGLPAQRTDMYLLWSAGPDGNRTLVGRFMVNHSGACRARFNLPGRHHAGNFWITPSSAPASVLASSGTA